MRTYGAVKYDRTSSASAEPSEPSNVGIFATYSTSVSFFTVSPHNADGSADDGGAASSDSPPRPKKPLRAEAPCARKFAALESLAGSSSWFEPATFTLMVPFFAVHVVASWPGRQSLRFGGGWTASARRGARSMRHPR